MMLVTDGKSGWDAAMAQVARDAVGRILGYIAKTGGQETEGRNMRYDCGYGVYW